MKKAVSPPELTLKETFTKISLCTLTPIMQLMAIGFLFLMIFFNRLSSTLRRRSMKTHLALSILLGTTLTSVATAGIERNADQLSFICLDKIECLGTNIHIVDVKQTVTVKRSDTLYPLIFEKLPKQIKTEIDGCTDCSWFRTLDAFNTDENPVFIHLLNQDKLYFNLNAKEYYLPLKSHIFKENTTETGQPNGSGTLIFEGQGFKVINNFYQAGMSWGFFGTVELYYENIKIMELSIRSL